MIRDATQADIPWLLGVGERFASRADLSETVKLDLPSLENTLRVLIDQGILIRGDQGTIGGMVFPHPFNANVKCASELFWWSEGREGLLLLSAFEARAKALGASLGAMIALEAVEPARTANVLLRRGYRLLERQFMKEL